jgi:hypothetical protein
MRDNASLTLALVQMSELLATRDRLTRLVEAYADTASELQRLAESREKRLSAIERLIGSFESCTPTLSFHLPCSHSPDHVVYSLI